MNDMIATYMIGLLLTAFIGGAWAWFGSVNKRERQIGARVALLSPAWPVLVAIGAWLGVRQLCSWANEGAGDE